MEGIYLPCLFVANLLMAVGTVTSSVFFSEAGMIAQLGINVATGDAPGFHDGDILNTSAS